MYGEGINLTTSTITSCAFVPPSMDFCQPVVIFSNSTHFGISVTMVLSTLNTYSTIDFKFQLNDGTQSAYPLTNSSNQPLELVCENPPNVPAPRYEGIYNPTIKNDSYSLETFHSIGYIKLKSDFKRPLADLYCQNTEYKCVFTYIELNKYMVDFIYDDTYTGTYSNNVIINGAGLASFGSVTSPLYYYQNFSTTISTEEFDITPYHGAILRHQANENLHAILNITQIPLYGSGVKDMFSFFKTQTTLIPSEIKDGKRKDFKLFNAPTISQTFFNSWRSGSDLAISVSTSSSCVQLSFYRDNSKDIIYTNYPLGLMSGTGNFSRTYKFGSLLRNQEVNWMAIFNSPDPKTIGFYNSGILVPDIVKPSLVSLDIIPLNDTTSVIRIGATDDLSGVLYIQIITEMQTITMYSKNLVKGTIKDGVYETFVNFKKNSKLKINVQDNNQNICEYTYDDIKAMFNIPFSYFPVIKSFTFDTGGVTFIGGQINLIVDLLGETQDQREFENSLFIKVFITASNTPIFPGVFDQNSQHYIFKISIPGRLMPGVLRYSIYLNQVEYPSWIFYQKYQLSSTIKVINEGSFDQMFPIISKVDVASPQTIDLTSTTQQFILWKIQIKDTTAISKVTITIASEYDLQGRNFSYSGNPSNQIDWDISYPIIAPRCREMKYYISYVYTEDTLGNKGETFRFSSQDIHPFYKFDGLTSDVVQVICSPVLNIETTPPTILSLTIDPVGLNSLFKYYTAVKFKLFDESDISLDHTPICYFNGADGQYISSLAGYDGSFYICSFDFPYGFGPVAILSIYGVSDIYYNFNGFTAADLSILNLQYYVDLPPLDEQPIIEFTSSLKESSDFLIINGYGFGIDNESKVFIKIESGGTTTLTPTISTGTCLTVVNLPPSSFYYIHVVRNGKESNIVVLQGPLSSSSSSVGSNSIIDSSSDSSGTPTTTPPATPKPVQCNSDCGLSLGYGKCVNGVCICVAPHSGLDCKAKIDNGTVITPDPVKPTVNVTIPGTSSGQTPEFISFVSVVSLRELDNSNENTVVNNYVFDSDKWILVKEGSYSNDQVTTVQYKYAINNSHNTTIVSTVQVFAQSTNITFGNQQLFMNPSTIKFTFNITPYPFTKSTNLLQIVMNAVLESTEKVACSYKEFVDDENNSQYLKIQIEDRSLFGRFIKFGMIDGREQVVTNTQLDSLYGGKELSKSTSDQSYIGLNIPYYTKYALLDPDFSVLIEQNTARDQANSICTSESQKKLTNAQIAGIVVGGVVFLFIVAAVTIYFVSKRGNSPIALKLRKLAQSK
ncbi:hypothetical protein CYY_002202 [Polysphondylium violaceum]|uniref:EGF-like domain-containing protein n=1 Tax=Polysphondylium violaceum TaxID=133409 RepID=A0A8J4Q213_9MYCE|nr:hypothetical protein CYY_002202 [Polysphondylium violaceum]